VNEYGMAYGFVAGQLHVADWDISPKTDPGKHKVKVPMDLFAKEMSAK